MTMTYKVDFSVGDEVLVDWRGICGRALCLEIWPDLERDDTTVKITEYGYSPGAVEGEWETLDAQTYKVRKAPRR